MSNIIEVHGVSHEFTDGDTTHCILNNVSINVPKHQRVAIMGSSGSGKTTLLHLMSGLSSATVGDILLLGESINRMPLQSLEVFRAKHLGFVFQYQHFFPELTVVQNVAMPLLLQNDPDAEDKASVLLKSLQIRPSLFTMRPTHLSGGEQSRAGLARALVHSPNILIADEPTSALDHHLSEEIFSYIDTCYQRQKFALVIATHDHSLLEHVDVAYTLKDGQLHEIAAG